MKQSFKSGFAIPGILTLMYHRVNNTNTDPWDICVSPQNFEEQIQLLTSSYNVVSVEETVKQIHSGNMAANSVCITFDDGYADNFKHAKPVLERYNCPAIFFIPTAYINADNCFWWDELELIFLHTKKLPEQLHFKINDSAIDYILNESKITEAQWLQHINWKWHQPPVTQRCSVFLEIWEKLRPLRYDVIRTKMNELKNWANLNYIPDMFRPVISKEQLYSLAQNELFTLGIHTHTHIDLNAKAALLQAEEITTCKKILADEFDTIAKCVAYPYGRYDDNTLSLCQALRLNACFTTQAGVIEKKSDTLQLPRCQAPDINKNAFEDFLIDQFNR